MYCPKCGKDTPADATFCDSCGADLKASASTAEQATKAKLSKPCKKPRLVKVILLAAVMIFLLLIIAYCALGRSAQEKLVEDFLNAQANGDGEALQKIVADPYYLEYVTDRDGYDIDGDRIDYYFRSIAENAMDSYEGYYGDNVKYSIDIDYERKYDSKDVKDIAEYLEDNYGYKADEVKSVISVEYTGEVEGDLVKSTINQGKAVLIKVEKKWYVSRLLSKTTIDEILN